MKKIIKLCLVFTLVLVFNNLISKQPIVSIITSVFNGDEFIGGFLEDIVRQTIFHDCELIIIKVRFYWQ